MYRLQIYLKSTGEDGSILKFLHITDGEITIKQLLYDATARFKAVYPSQGRLAVVRVQDSSGCDLDPGFLVAQVCSKNDELYFFTDKKFPTVFKRVLNPIQSPAKKRKLLEENGDSPVKSTRKEKQKSGSQQNSQAASPSPQTEDIQPQQTPTPAARNASSNTSASLGSQKKNETKDTKKIKVPQKTKGASLTKPAPSSPPAEPQQVVKSNLKAATTTIGPNLIEDSQSSSIESIKMPPPPPVIQETPDRAAANAAARLLKREDTPAIPRTRAATLASANSEDASQNEDDAEEEDAAADEDTTASESSDDEVSGPVKAVEMPKITPPVSKKSTPRRPDLKVDPSKSSKSSPPPSGPSGPAAPVATPLAKPARKSLSNLSKLESLPTIDVHDGPKKTPIAKKTEASDDEGLSTDKSTDSSNSSSDGDSSSESEKEERPMRKPRRSTLFSSIIGRK